MVGFILESISSSELLLLFLMTLCFFVALGIGIYVGKKFIKPVINKNKLK
jgi:uncharacterized protein YneF (UPF0154 family)